MHALFMRQSKEGIQILEKILSDEKIYTEDHVGWFIYKSLEYINHPVRKELVDIALSDKKFYNNANFIQQLSSIIYHNNVKKLEFKIKFLKKILSNKNLANNKAVIYNLAGLLEVSTPKGRKIANKILSNKKLYNNEDFMQNIENIIYHAEKDKLHINIIKRILSKKRLYNNEFIVKYIVVHKRSALICIMAYTHAAGNKLVPKPFVYSTAFT